MSHLFAVLEPAAHRLPAAPGDALTLRGRRLALAGDFEGGVRQVWSGAERVCGRVAWAADAALASDGGAAPEGAVRTIGPVREAVAVSREAPVAVWWWRATADTAVRIRVEPGADAAQVPGPGGSGARWSAGAVEVAVALDGPEGAWRLRADGAALRVDGRLQAGATLRLALAADADGARLPALLAAALSTDEPLRGGRAAIRRRAREGLRATAEDARVGAALAWARHRLDSHHVELPDGRCVVSGLGGAAPPAVRLADAALAGLAAAAAGDSALAREAAAWLLARPAAEGALAHRLLLPARILAWQGGLGFAAQCWPRLRALLDAPRAEADVGPAGDLRWAVALAEVAVLAEALGLAADAAELRARAGALTAGRPAAVAELFAPPGPPAPWAAWATCGAGATDAWLVAAGRPGDAGPGAWRGAGHPDGAAAAAGVLLGFVHGVLGARPDATRHRLVLRPVLPATWTRLEVAGLPLGDAAVTLSYTRRGGVHRFEVEAETGAVPPQLVLEPALQGSGVRGVRVDGVGAELDARRAGERLVVPVQVPLDGPRVLEVEMED